MYINLCRFLFRRLNIGISRFFCWVLFIYVTVYSFSIVIIEKIDFWKMNVVRFEDVWRNSFQWVFFCFFFVVYFGKSVWVFFFYKSCVVYLLEKKIIYWKYYIIIDKKNEKDVLIFMEVFDCFFFV